MEERVLIRVCSFCGKEYNYYSDGAKADYCSDNCFERDFWENSVLKRPKHIEYNGHAYFLDEPVDWKTEEERKWLGFEGWWYWFELEDGTIVGTNNMWSRGELPEQYRGLLPQGKMVRGEKCKNYKKPSDAEFIHNGKKYGE